MKIDTESLTRDLFDELLPLAQKCWQESTTLKAEKCAFYGERDFQIEPDFEAYQKLGDALVIVTLRQERLLGYIVGFSYRALHHKHVLGGIADTMYIEPEFRSYAPVLAERFEKAMKDQGVVIIGWPATEGAPLHLMLKSMGYVGDDVVMEKRLCA